MQGICTNIPLFFVESNNMLGQWPWPSLLSWVQFLFFRFQYTLDMQITYKNTIKFLRDEIAFFTRSYWSFSELFVDLINLVWLSGQLSSLCRSSQDYFRYGIQNSRLSTQGYLLDVSHKGNTLLLLSITVIINSPQLFLNLDSNSFYISGVR